MKKVHKIGHLCLSDVREKKNRVSRRRAIDTGRKQQIKLHVIGNKIRKKNIAERWNCGPFGLQRAFAPTGL